VAERVLDLSNRRAALKRVLAKLPVVPEDVLRYRHLMELAQEAGLVPELHYAPTTTYRGGVETVYYLGLQRLPPLQRLLPCTFDMVFEKRTERRELLGGKTLRPGIREQPIETTRQRLLYMRSCEAR
jgi:hypothetical protein